MLPNLFMPRLSLLYKNSFLFEVIIQFQIMHGGDFDNFMLYELFIIIIILLQVEKISVKLSDWFIDFILSKLFITLHSYSR